MPLNKRKPATASSCSCCEVSPSPAKQAKPSPTPRTLVSPALQLAHQDTQSTETAVPATPAVYPGVRASSSGINRLHRHTVSTGNVVSFVHESSGDESDDATTASERSLMLVRSKVTTVNIPSTQSPRPLLVDDSDFDTEPESMDPDIIHTNLITGSQVPHASARKGQRANTHTGRSDFNPLNCSVLSLLNKSLAPSTFTSYKNAWRHYQSFHQLHYNSHVLLPVPTERLAQFISS
ncbi:uncharacterized protein LOC127874993 [Dreissena polymorpha]|uniref:uncharacterized protein LOC127874993 n=1 Tax=Dreissena polymorpha TaxID=45954 RepID=UPI0022652A42|nr:uncharacterized protein LOC127874993 [Dreissena polymorpha]